MARSSASEEKTRKAAEPRRDEENASSRLRLESVREGASGAATIAAGGSSFIVDLEQLESLGLARAALVPGVELGEADEATLRLAAETHEAERRGLALLARAEQSRFMLRAKLEARGFSSRAVGLALGRLSAQHWLDDSRFARAYISSRLGRRVDGPASLAAALRGRGVDAETAKAAIDAVLEPAAREAALRRAFEKELKKAHGDVRTAKVKLRGLGFCQAELAAFLEEHGDDFGQAD